MKSLPRNVSIAALLNAASWIVIYWLVPPTGDPVILHYNIFIGIDLIGDWSQLLWMPISGVVYLVVNTALAWLVRKRESVLSAILLISSIILQAIILTATILIAMSNLS